MNDLLKPLIKAADEKKSNIACNGRETGYYAFPVRKPGLSMVAIFMLLGFFASSESLAGAGEIASQNNAQEQGGTGWNWPDIKVPSLGSLSVNLNEGIASLSLGFPDRQMLDESLASGVVAGLAAAREIASAAFDAARDDLERHATWQYKVVDLENSLSAAEIEQKLTDLGKEKWELLSVTSLPNKTRYYFKKRGMSLLRVIAPMFAPDR